MNTRDTNLIRLIRESGEDWLLRLASTEGGSVSQVRDRLDAAYAGYREKFPDLRPGEPSFNDESVIAEASANPHRVRALLQAIGASSPMMVALVWRIVQGDTIMRIEMRYQYEQEFSLSVTIENDLAGRVVEFSFDRIEDATFLRHLGIMREADQPIFDGYYALNISK